MTRPCNCVAEFNAKLREHNTRIVETIGIPHDGRPMFTRPTIRTEKVESRKRVGPAIAVPTFCPFCGNRYEPEPPTWESIATAPRDRRIRVSHELDPSSRKIETIAPTFGEWDESNSEWVCNAGFICNDGMLRFEPTHWLFDPASAQTDGGAA